MTAVLRWVGQRHEVPSGSVDWWPSLRDWGDGVCSSPVAWPALPLVAAQLVGRRLGPRIEIAGGERPAHGVPCGGEHLHRHCVADVRWWGALYRRG